MVVRKVNGKNPIGGLVTIPNASTGEYGVTKLHDEIDNTKDKAITPRAVNVHAERVASEEGFGHVKVDGSTIRISSSGKLQVDASVRNIIWEELDSFDMSIVGNFMYNKVENDGCDIPMYTTESFMVEILPIYYNDGEGHVSENRIVTVRDINSNNTIQYSRKYNNLIEHPELPTGQEKGMWSVVGYRPDGLTITTDENGVLTAIPVRGDKGETGESGRDGEKGETGEGFSISKTYPTIYEMESEHSTDGIAIGKFVIIANPNNIDDSDNGKVFVKAPSEYVFVVDMSGSVGLKGEDGKDGVSVIAIPNENRLGRIWIGTTNVVGNEGLWSIDYSEANFSEVRSIQVTMESSITSAASKPLGTYVVSKTTTGATGKAYKVSSSGVLLAMQQLPSDAGVIIHVMVVGH